MRVLTTTLAILVVCLIPVIPTTYETVEWRQVKEQHITVEPYTTTEEISQPYTRMAEMAEWQDDGSWDRYKNSIFFTTEESIAAFQAVTPGRWEIKQYPVVKYQTVSQTVTRYQEVTKTRLVNRPVAKEQSRLISIVELVIRR